ncbi:hypothetical protein O3S80_50720 [Streptomyces sp. Lzd4kr]|nr:hypothetical protein [Streptomyces sp. Lzd4kr]
MNTELSTEQAEQLVSAVVAAHRSLQEDEDSDLSTSWCICAA